MFLVGVVALRRSFACSAYRGLLKVTQESLRAPANLLQQGDARGVRRPRLGHWHCARQAALWYVATETMSGRNWLRVRVRSTASVQRHTCVSAENQSFAMLMHTANCCMTSDYQWLFTRAAVYYSERSCLAHPAADNSTVACQHTRAGTLTAEQGPARLCTRKTPSGNSLFIHGATGANVGQTPAHLYANVRQGIDINASHHTRKLASVKQRVISCTMMTLQCTCRQHPSHWDSAYSPPGGGGFHLESPHEALNITLIKAPQGTLQGPLPSRVLSAIVRPLVIVPPPPSTPPGCAPATATVAASLEVQPHRAFTLLLQATCQLPQHQQPAHAAAAA